MGAKYIALTRKAGAFVKTAEFRPVFKPLTKITNHDPTRIVD
jgi:hypothetical protein